MFTCSRTNKSGGGVALYNNDSLQHKYLPDMSKCLDNCAGVVSLEIALKNGKKAIICCIYRAPKTDLEQLNEFISNFCRNLVIKLYIYAVTSISISYSMILILVPITSLNIYTALDYIL